MKKIVCIILFSWQLTALGQSLVDISGYENNGTLIKTDRELLTVQWPCGKADTARMQINLSQQASLISTLAIGRPIKTIAKDLDPVFILRVGKRTLSAKGGGWNVFFDKVPLKPYSTELISFNKKKASVHTNGASTVVKLTGLKTKDFAGHLEITIYSGSPLLNIAAVMTTQKDSTAILYDAGLVSKKKVWKHVAWSNIHNQIEQADDGISTQSVNQEVKYRTIIGESNMGSLAVFPAPHQYFYPLDEAFNLKFTWYGKNYLNLVSDYGIGIRQEPSGDNRWVPWFNAPPGTDQRLNFFCMLSAHKSEPTLQEVKKFTNNDAFVRLPGYKTFASHFHNEFIISEVMNGKPIPAKPEFVSVLKGLGLDIVKLAEFHMGGHPKGPDSIRLAELNALFDQTRRLSDSKFLLLPGEEANNFYGGHWLAFFPKPVYWIMSRKPDAPFVSKDPRYGTVYRVGNKEEMLQLLEKENGLAWVAHARTKGSTGYPDRYKNETFFKSDTYFGAAWKSIPADLSWPGLSHRVLDLMDEMANWGYRKYAIGESDLFTITHQNEMYAHMNVTYLKLKTLPKYNRGWSSVLDVMRKGKFFVSTGEVLIPSFTINGKESGDVLKVNGLGKATINAELGWTFPLVYAEIVSGDGHKIYREKINLNHTQAFGRQKFRWPIDLTGKKWVRIEAWDIAANGAYTPMIWLE